MLNIAPARPAGTQRTSVPALANRGACEPQIVLDLSRLLSRILHPTPTGIDRVEMAYARTLMRHIPDRLAFAAVHPVAGYGRIPFAAAAHFFDVTEAQWHGGADGDWTTHVRALAALGTLRPRAVPRADRPRILLQASPHHLDRPATVAAKLSRERARLLCLVHDLIPITHPEYARPGGAARHARRMATLVSQASGLLTNSRATAAALAAWAGDFLGDTPVRVAPLGIDRRPPEEGDPVKAGRPYFLCLGTIETRKNHLLLLTIWRSLIGALGRDAAPMLILVGRRGWENENVVDMLDRCTELNGVVFERPRLADAALAPLMRGACALLMPSFAEGFGLPIAEALAAGTPVIASDLPAHRETGGDGPDYLDPLDGAGWRTAILAYAAPDSARRAAQLDRLRHWAASSWDDHLAIALDLAGEIAAC